MDEYTTRNALEYAIAASRRSEPNLVVVGVVSMMLSAMLLAGGAFIASNLSQNYSALSAKAAALEQQAKQFDNKAQIAGQAPPHRALTPAETDAAISYIDTLRDPNLINSDHGPISRAQNLTLRRLMTTPGQVVFDPQTSPRYMPGPGRGVIHVDLSLNGQLYLDLCQGTGTYDYFRFHGTLNADGTFNDGPEIVTPVDNCRAEAVRLRYMALTPDGPGSSVREAATELDVTNTEIGLLALSFVAGALLLGKRPLGILLQRVYAVCQLPMCFVLAFIYASHIDQTAPVGGLAILGLVPSALVGCYALIILWALWNASIKPIPLVLAEETFG